MIPFSKFKSSVSSNLPLREQYFQGLIFTPGQYVSDGKSTFEILECGPNYVTVRDANANLSKKFITNITLSEKTKEMNGGIFKGFNFKSELSEDVQTAVDKSISDYTSGKFNDSIALLKALKSIDEGRFSDAFQSLQRIGQAKNHPYLKEVQEMNHNQIVMATQIAEQFGGSYSRTPSETIETVLESLIHINHASAHDAVIRVLELAEATGIEIGEKYIGFEKLSHKLGPKLAAYIGNKKYGKKGMHDSKTEHRKEDKEMHESFIQNGDHVVVNKKYSSSYGHVLNNHGTVIEVKHSNGKVSFHPHSIVKKAEISNTPTPVQKTQLNTIATLGAKAATDPKTGVIGPQVKDNAPGVSQKTKINVIQPSPAVLTQTKNTLLGNI